MTPTSHTRNLVIAAHGVGNDAFFPFIHYFEYLLAKGFSVYAFDLDGHGHSSTTVFDHNIVGMMEDAFEQIPMLGQYSKIHLLGQSLGGLLSLDFLKRKNLDSACMIGTPISSRMNTFDFYA